MERPWLYKSRSFRLSCREIASLKWWVEDEPQKTRKDESSKTQGVMSPLWMDPCDWLWLSWIIISCTMMDSGRNLPWLGQYLHISALHLPIHHWQQGWDENSRAQAVRQQIKHISGVSPAKSFASIWFYRSGLRYTRLSAGSAWVSTNFSQYMISSLLVC